MPIVDRELVAAITSPFPEITTVPAGLLFYQKLQDHLAKYGDSLWMMDVTTGKSLTYSQLLEQIDLVAANLHQRGLRLGDVVLIMTSNHLEMAVFFLAVWRAGGCTACLTLNLLPEDIRFRINEVGAKFILTDMKRGPRVLEAVESLDSVKEVFIIGHLEKCTSFDELLAETVPECPRDFEVDETAMCWMLYSSGTTGIPKAIVHTHRTVKILAQSEWSQLFSNRKLFFINLLTNGGGWSILLCVTLGHGHLYTMSEGGDEDLLRVIDQVKPDIVSMFPSQVVYICRHPNLDQFDLSSVSMVMSTGSTMNPFYERDIYDKFPNLRLFNFSYGMSEVMSISTNLHELSKLSEQNPRSTKLKHVLSSVGRLTPNNRLKIIDPETGEKLGPNQVGEIWVQTPFVMKEYLNKPEETAKTIIDGWVHTGDKGYYDSEENIFVVGRFKELIKYRMAHVVPTNIEKHLLTHPAIQDAGVVGKPDDLDGELPTAFVVVKVGYSLTADEVVDYVDNRLMDEEKLRGGIRFTGRIPRNDLGKIVRPLLAKMLPPA